jgi:hypothetical protein
MPSFALDIRSLSVVLTAVSAILSITMALIRGTHKTYSGFGFWPAGNTAYAFAFLLIALRGTIPEIFAIVLANVLILSAVAAACRNLCAISTFSVVSEARNLPSSCRKPTLPAAGRLRRV